MLPKDMEKPAVKALIIIVLLIFTIFFAFPLFWMLMTSLKTRNDFLSMPPVWVFKPTFENYEGILGSPDFVKSYLNSIIVSVFSVSLGMLVGVPAAYGMSRFHFKQKSGLAIWILSTRFAPPIAVLLPFYIMYKYLCLSDTYFGLIIIYLIINLPLIVWIMYGFFKDVPIELEEAAIVEGVSPPKVFVIVALPLVAPGLVATLILSLVFCWNELLFAMIIAGYSTRTLPVAIYNFVSYQEIAWGSLSAAGMTAIIPVAIFTLLIQKYLVSGLTFGAIKG